MNRFLMAAAFVALGAASASAADLAARPYTKAPVIVDPSYNWSGWYIGVNAGWIGSASNITNTATETAGGALGSGLLAGAIPTSIGARHDGFIGGGQIGYNWQAGSIVYGLEADFDGTDARRNVSFGPSTAVGAAITTNYSRNLDWLATVRGRLGVTVAPALLLYGTGGLAVGETKIGNTFICPTCGPDPATEPGSTNVSTRTSTGWTAGAGAEWGFAPQWSAKVEYLYVDLGRQSSTITYLFGPPGARNAFVSSLTSTVRNTENIVRAGINYRFGGPAVARY